MKAIRVHQTGGPEVLTLDDIADPQPGPGQVLIRQRAIAVNFIDVAFRTGLYKGPPLPFVPGVEGAGEIAAIGDAVTGFTVGERVAAVAGPNAYSELRVVPAQRVVKVPKEITDTVAGGTLSRGLTAWFLLRRTFAVRAEQNILWHAAAGGLGLIAGQWAAHLGANVIGTVGSSAKEEVARQHGYSHIINYRSEDVSVRIGELTNGRGVDVVYDPVGKDTYLQSIRSLRKFGTWVSFGNASGVVPPLDLNSLQKGSIYITRPTLFDYIEEPSDLQTGAREYFDLVGQGVIAIDEAQTMPLSRAADAHRALQDRDRKGVVVLIP
jgi:NADPH:quinone reductase